MNISIKGTFYALALIGGLGVSLAGRLSAQTFTVLYQFSGGDGLSPSGSLLLSSNALYGTAEGGGAGNGTVFQINADGTGFNDLYVFSPSPFSGSTNSDGKYPLDGLILSGGVLYGTTSEGGNSGNGTLFAINTDGTGFTNLHFFSGLPQFDGTNGDGSEPVGPLALSGNTLYGTTAFGGPASNGTVFAVNIDGTGFTNLHNFTGGSDGPPAGSVLLSGTTLYGLTGANGGNGSLFKINTDGTGFTNIYAFVDSAGLTSPGGLILSGGKFYGVAGRGGAGNLGGVFRINLDGTGITNLHSFSVAAGYSCSGFTISGATMYGITEGGGSSNQGTIFALATDGTGFANLYEFKGGNEGTFPGGLVSSGNALYGTANEGGQFNFGTIFSLSLPAGPSLSIALSGPNVILQWPTNAVGFFLLSSRNLVSPVVWANVPGSAVVLGGQNSVTTPISGSQMFYRLSR